MVVQAAEEATGHWWLREESLGLSYGRNGTPYSSQIMCLSHIISAEMDED